MTNEQRLAELRELFLLAPESATVRILALVFSLMLACTVLWLVRRRTLRAEYTPIWMGVAVALLALTVDLDVLRLLTRLIGAWTISSTVFFIGQVFLVLIALSFSVRLSQAGTRIQSLAQEVALLNGRIDALEPRAPTGEGGA